MRSADSEGAIVNPALACRWREDQRGGGRASSHHIFGVSGFELDDETIEEGGLGIMALGLVVIRQITAAAAEDFADGSGRKVAQFDGKVVGAQKDKYLFGGPEESAIEGVDEERALVGKTADHEMAGEADGLKF